MENQSVKLNSSWIPFACKMSKLMSNIELYTQRYTLKYNFTSLERKNAMEQSRLNILC